MSILQSLYNFFSSELGLLIFGSIIIPFMFGLYSRYNKGLDEKLRRQQLTRVIIYRYGLIDNACCDLNFDGALNIIKGISEISGDDANPYTPMLNGIEDNTNIYGLIMGALNEKELSKTAVPESVSNLSELSKILKDLEEYKKNKNNDDKKQEKNNELHNQKRIHSLVSILNELIVDKENFKDYLYSTENNPIYIPSNYINNLIFRYKKRQALRDAKKFSSSIGSLYYSKSYLTQQDIRSGFNFNEGKKFYYDKNRSFRISFPREDWSASNEILKKCLEKKETNKKGQIAFVLVHRGIDDFYEENINVAIRDIDDQDFETSLTNHIHDEEQNSKFLVKHAPEIDTNSATIEFESLNKNRKTYHRFQRYLTDFNKNYIITATFDKENCDHLKDDLTQILNSFFLIK